jgi:hypothetical protein
MSPRSTASPVIVMREGSFLEGGFGIEKGYGEKAGDVISQPLRPNLNGVSARFF